MPVETLPARYWAPVWRKANLRDEPPSKSCWLHNDFAQRPFLQNRLDLPPPGRRLLQLIPVRAGQEVSNNIFQTWQKQQLYIKF
jgi:hypothetical protein